MERWLAARGAPVAALYVHASALVCQDGEARVQHMVLSQTS